MNETLEKWKDGASVVLSYRAQQHLEMDIYKVVAEQKVEKLLFLKIIPFHFISYDLELHNLWHWGSLWSLITHDMAHLVSLYNPVFY